MNNWMHMTEAQRKYLDLIYKFITHQCIDIFIVKTSMISFRDKYKEHTVSGPNFEEY